MSEIFDGKENIQILKPIIQSKITARDLDPTGQDIIRKISAYSPLYLATKNAFPDSGDDSREAYCKMIFRRSAKALIKKYSTDKTFVQQLNQAQHNYDRDIKYAKLINVLVGILSSLNLLCNSLIFS